jgi:hypothetical protein
MASVLARLAPWSGLAAGAIAAAADQQILADLPHYDCMQGGPMLGLAIGIVATLVAVAGGMVSLRTARQTSAASDFGTRRFIGTLGVLGALLGCFAIVLLTAAAWIVPQCAP